MSLIAQSILVIPAKAGIQCLCLNAAGYPLLPEGNPCGTRVRRLFVSYLSEPQWKQVVAVRSSRMAVAHVRDLASL